MAIILAAPQQPAPRTATAHVEGVVVDITNGDPLNGAQVQLRGQTDQAYRRVVTDNAGRFSFDDVVPGTTIMLVSHEGFSGESITETLAANAPEVRRVELTPLASIAGRIEDINRRPAAKIEVQLLRDRYDDMGRRSVEPVNAKMAVHTDDNGDYRISGIPPGEYYVRAASPVEAAKRTIGALLPSANTLGATYYPGVSTPDEARPLRVNAGQNIESLDFTIDPPSRFKITGRILNSVVPTPADRYGYFLVRRDLQVRDSEGLVADMDPDPEHFEFRNVAPGSYDLYVACRVAPAGPGFFVGKTSVAVADQDVRDVVVAIEPGIDISGTWKSDDSVSPKAATSGTIDLRSLDGMPDILAPRLQIHEDGTLDAPHVPAGRYMLHFSMPDTFFVAGARLGPPDVFGQAFEIDANSTGTFFFDLSTAVAGLSGTVTDAMDNPVSGATVLLSPSAELKVASAVAQLDSSSFKLTTTNLQGRFTMKGIRPGRYTAFAITDKLDGSRSLHITPYLNYGTPIELQKGQAVSQDLRLIPKQ